MKHRLMTILALAVLVGPISNSPAFADDTTYGEGVTGQEVVRISQLLANPAAHVGTVVRVEGVVTEVCAKRGCWVAIASDQEFQTLRFKVKDGVIVFTPDVKGKRGVFEGVFTRHELTQEDAIARAKHHAEEQGEEFDPASITGPEVYYQLHGTGAVVR